MEKKILTRSLKVVIQTLTMRKTKKKKKQKKKRRLFNLPSRSPKTHTN
jgi:hypothetical protein